MQLLKPLVVLLLIGCCNTASSKNKIVTNDTTNTILLEQFKQFCKDASTNNKEIIKSYFSFPSRFSGLFIVVNDSDYVSFNADRSFEEKDYDNYFENIFSKDFFNLIGKFNTCKLRDSKEISKVIKHSNYATTLSVLYDVSEKRIILSIKHSEGTGGTSEAGIDETGFEAQYAIIFIFRKDINQKLKIIDVGFAG